DSIFYNTSWYRDTQKANGGYSLELIDPLQPCSDVQNWMASIAPEGGTPGAQNSVFNGQDEMPPSLIHVSIINSTTLRLTFDEPIEESTLHAGQFVVNGVEAVSVLPISYRELEVTLSSPML